MRPPPTRVQADRRLAIAAALYVAVQFVLSGLSLIVSPTTMAAAWIVAGLGVGFAVFAFETAKAARARRRG